MLRLLLLILFEVLFVHASAYSDGTNACNGIAWPHAIQDHVLPPVPHGEHHCHVVSLQTTGRWLIDVGVDALDRVQPRLLLPSSSCDPEQSGESSLRILHRMPASALLEVSTPGRYGFCVAADDPQAPLGAYRLTSWFRPSTGIKSDPDEDEPDPDPLVSPPQTRWHSVSAAATETSSAPPFWLGCADAIRDDHGDQWACATPLSLRSTIDATLQAADSRMAWPDEDLFRLDVTAWHTVVLRVHSQVDLLAALYTADGQRLTTANYTDDPGDVRIARMIGPGTYFLRILARSPAGGRYGLTVSEVD